MRAKTPARATLAVHLFASKTGALLSSPSCRVAQAAAKRDSRVFTLQPGAQMTGSSKLLRKTDSVPEFHCSILHPCMTEFIYRIYITSILYLIKINYFFFFFAFPFLPFFFFGFHAIPRCKYASKNSLQSSLFLRKILP